MTNDQVIAAIAGFLVVNGMTIWGVARWGIGKAIAYTHLERDVLELQMFKKDQEEKNAKLLIDLKGLSIKINKTLEKQ